MKKGSFLIVIAGIFWGCMGIFVRTLGSFGFTPMQIVSIRVSFAAVIFCMILLKKDRSGFIIRMRDIPLFLGLGLGSVLFFTVCYFTAISMMSLSAAAILLYTSPIWIMLMSLLFFHEKITGRKIMALLLAFGGCVLVSGVFGSNMNLKGVLIGLGSGIGYALYSILGTVALRRYSPYTVTAYTFLLAAAGSLIICDSPDMVAKYAGSGRVGFLVLLSIITAIVTAVIPFLTYTLGLKSVEAGRAGILATVEPLVATIVGVTVFSEPLTLVSLLGILLIISAIIILNLEKK